MKTPILAAALFFGLMATAATAQTTPPRANGAAAATLPDAFGEPEPDRTAALPPRPAATAPDIARSEEALRAVIGSLQSDAIDYSMFSDDLATQIRERAADFTPLVRRFGALKSIDHRGQQDGADLFRVVFENQATDWVIAFNDDDRIAALLFRPARD
nr:hypothetical protein [uncultured Brevundimonas sp.]